MTDSRTHTDIQLEADLAAVRDIIQENVVYFPDGGDPNGEFGNAFIKLSHDPDEGKYHVHIGDDDQYRVGDKVRIGRIGMTLIFNSDLVVVKAQIEVTGESGRGFDKKVGKRRLGGFVANILVQLQEELIPKL